MDSLRVAVVGCGTAGAASALFLARAGHAVTVFERVPEPGAVGAGILLQPTGQAVMARLGLLAPIAAAAAPIERLLCRTARGRIVVDLPYTDVDRDVLGFGLHRGVLFGTLFAVVRADPRIALHCGVTIDSMQLDRDVRWLRGADQSFGPFELVVVADGSISELHDDTAIPHTVRRYPWGALWFVARDPERRFSGELHQVVDGARHMAGFLPTGLGPDGDPVTSLFWSIRADRVAAWRAAGLEPWKRELLRFDPRCAFILDQIDSVDQIVFTQYRDVAMKHWHEPGVVFLGDAAHATSPQLGQGANLALWDALVLGEAIAAAPTVSAALDAYTRARRRHLAYYQFATRTLTPFFQGDSRLLGWIRDLVFPASRWLRPLRRKMVRTMAGLERGIIRPPIPIAEIKGLLAPTSAARAAAR